MAGEALVIGGAGFLGRGIVNELRRAGWSVTSAGRGRKQNTVPGVAFVRVDRSQPGALARAFGDRRLDLVVDCAAYVHCPVVALLAIVPVMSLPRSRPRGCPSRPKVDASRGPKREAH